MRLWIKRAVRITDPPPHLVAPVMKLPENAHKCAGFSLTFQCFKHPPRGTSRPCEHCGQPCHHPVHNHPSTTQLVLRITFNGGGLGVSHPHI